MTHRLLPLLAAAPRPVGALLFDCDGTLADSMGLHYEAWNAALTEHGAYFNEALFYAWAGVPARQIIGRLNAAHGWNLDARAIARRKEQLFVDLIPRVTPIPRVIRLAEEAAACRLPAAVVTGGTRRACEATLRALGIRHLFAVICTTEDVPRGKPDPAGFLLAAERLAVAPARCIVFEDGQPGIVAARAAGMAAVDVREPVLAVRTA